ncbi:SprT-like protein [Teratosphaeria destructans]|uniref:SprT-like protein n=1 Tax=Teratosphaeria destructans TaxID=418781 RepID=A0A9W7SPY5_9PEZI|nr:SprT-like protein [Teratosphaeria destructans]
MARLRRESTEGHEGAAATFPGLKSGNTSQSRPSRRSPRKRLADPTISSSLIYDDDDIRGSALVPKVAPKASQTSRQIRLGPIATLENPKDFPKLRLPLKKTQSLQPDLGTSSLPPSVEASTVKATEVEESIWCGSDADSDASEEVLPSPSNFMKPRPRPFGHAPTSDQQAADLAFSLKALQITDTETDEPSRSAARTPSAGRISKTQSSSDKENDDQAVLRFSPPRFCSPHRQITPARAVTPPPTSPSKGKLLSPSKRLAQRIPTPPLQISVDAFWNAEAVNDWNDQYSPQKDWKSPSKVKLLATERETSQPSSPRKSPTKRTKAEIQAQKDWEARKHSVAETFLEELDKTVTGGQIKALAASTGGVKFLWSKTLNSTAGRANWKRETTKTRQADGSIKVEHKHFASIELASKVIDDEHRLLNVIAHEFCHLCNFMISGIKDQPHGASFKAWGKKCTKVFGDRGVEVTTKHTYEIEYKYIWRCSNEDCGTEFKRHSRSIDPERHTCGACRSKLEQLKPVPRKGKDGSSAGNGSRSAGGVTGYAAFVKKHFAAVKAALPAKTSHKEVMEALARKYREEKAKSGGDQNGREETKPSAKALIDLSDDSNGDSSSPGPAWDDVEKVAKTLEFVVLDDE